MVNSLSGSPHSTTGSSVGGVPTVLDVAFDDLSELRVEDELTDEPVEQRGETADGCRRDHAVGPDDTSSFLQRSDAVGPILQVVERAEHQDGIDAARGNGSRRASPTLALRPRLPKASSACSTWRGVTSRRCTS
jgi:hypothetical protein